ncbi:MAG: phytanoyl-CoA dioxygenase [Rhodospirillaceae bacterium]|nr:phytanoyl-CoA dioxygenase [Rhodospirillaceae bacterium]
MIKTPILSDSQIAEFQRDGYVVCRGAFNTEETDTITTWATEVEELPELPGKQWVFHEESALDGSDLINRIEYISPFHSGFASLTENLRHAAGQLLGDDAVLFKEKINFKMPGGGGFEPHQDSQAGWEVYASNFITAMICIDEATVENGCLEIAAGENKRGLIRGMEPLTANDTSDMNFIAVPTRPGDMVLFDAYTPHRSAPNPTTEQRRVYYATYNRASEGDHIERYYADKRKNFPPDIERDPDREYVYKV